MIRQRALAWAAVLALVATIQIAPLPIRFSASVAALAQGASAAEAGQPTDLAVVTLHCAEAPATEALTSFFTTGAAPTGCAPAVGVTIAVTENESPLSDSPFTTDIAGTLTVRVGLGSAVEVKEDPKSLPAGYEPLTREANGVPYANPVRLDSAVAEAAVLFVNVPASVAAALAQEPTATEAGQPTDLAVVALHCADAPATESLTSFFSSGTPPTGCAPAVGVSVAVTENEKPLSGSPFRTDTAGTLAVRVSLGSAVSVKEDSMSLPAGYEPLTQEANGVPYANPVRLDSAVAGAAVLFINVPASVNTALTSGTPAFDAGEATDLTHAVTPVGQAPARAATARMDRTGCDPAYPDERTCIAPGPPLDEPCSLTDQRNFTVLSPDPRGLDTDGDGIGCEPISPSGGTIGDGASFNLVTSGGYLRRAAPARNGDLAVAASRVRTGDGGWVLPPERSRADDWFVHRDRNRAGLWFVAPDRISTGNLAVVSNPVFIANGLWTGLDHTRDGGWFSPGRNRDDDWFRHNLLGNGVWLWPGRIAIGNLAVARSGSGNLAVVSNPVFISNGLLTWPNHPGNDDWFWHSRVSVGNLTIARSGNGNVAVVSNSIFIANGVWHWPGHLNNGDWRWPNHISNVVWFWPSNISVGNLTIARSGDGNIAIVSNPIFISSGVWFVPHVRIHDDDWLEHDDRDHADTQLVHGGAAQADRSDVEPLTINGGGASDAPPSKIEQIGSSEQATLTVNGGIAVEPPPADSIQPPGDSSTQPPAELVRPPTDSNVTLPSDGYVESPPDAAAQPLPDARAAEPNYLDAGSDPSYIDPSYVDAGNVDPGYVAPDPGIDADYVAPQPSSVDAGSDPGAATPEPSYVEPSYVEPSYDDAGIVDPGNVAPDAGNEPSYSAPEPSYVDPGIDTGYVAPETNHVDAGNVAPNPGMDTGYSGPDPSNLAAEPSVVDPGIDAGYVDPGNADPGTIAPDPGMDVAGNVDAGNGAPDASGGRSDHGRGDHD